MVYPTYWLRVALAQWGYDKGEQESTYLFASILTEI